MLPPREPGAGAASAARAQCLSPWRQFVRARGLGGAGAWREVVRSFGEDGLFLEFCARRDSGGERVLLEFGLERGGPGARERWREGFLDVYWQPAEEDFGAVVALSVGPGGEDWTALARHAQPYLELPLLAEDVVEDDGQ